VQRWPETGTPPSPAGWIITTARRLGRAGEAEQAYRAAITAARNTAERDFLDRRLRSLASTETDRGRRPAALRQRSSRSRRGDPGLQAGEETPLPPFAG